VPDERPDDALRTLQCGLSILDALDEWNIERARSGEAPIRVGIGAHYGAVVIGDIGSERSMSFAVVGDTTNIASRLQDLTRDLGCSMVASDAIITTARDHDGRTAAALADGFRRAPALPLRGRSATIDVWAHGQVARSSPSPD
jgi:adenylate cyclase